jgi:zinc protease
MVVLHHEQPSVSVRLLVRAGAASDPRDKHGLASLAAAVLDQGTTSRSASEIAETIDFIGGGMGVSAGTDLTFVSTIVMKDSFEFGMRLLSDVARNPAFAQEEIDRQKQQALSALQVSAEDPGYVADAVFDRLVFGFHPYGLPSNGTPASIASITRDDLAAFHRRHFVPNNAVLAIVGDVTSEEAFSTAKKVFGDWESRELARDAFVDPPEPTRRVIVVNKPDAVQTEVRMGHLGIPRNHPDYMALNLATRVLGGEGSNRLHQVLRTDRGLTYGAQADMDALKESGNIIAETNTRSEATAEVVRLMVDEFWRMQRERVNDRELENAKAYMTGSFPLTIETPDAIAMQVLNVVFYGLPLDELQNFRDRVNVVTADDIQRVARTYFKPDRLSIVLVGNASAFVSQLPGVGLPQFEVIDLADLDLTAANLRRSRSGAAAPPQPAVRLASSQQPPAAPQRPDTDAPAARLLDRMIAAKGGLERLRSIRTIKAVTTAVVSTPDGPLEAETTTYLEYPNRVHLETTLPTERQLQVYDGRQGWVRDARGVREVPDAAIRAIELTFARDVISALLAARDGRLRARLLPDVRDESGDLLHALELSGTDVDPFVLLVDPASALVSKQTYVVGGPGRPLVEERSSDYRAVQGVQIAFKATVRQGGRQVLERRVTAFEINAPLDPALFTRPDA